MPGGRPPCVRVYSILGGILGIPTPQQGLQVAPQVAEKCPRANRVAVPDRAELGDVRLHGACSRCGVLAVPPVLPVLPVLPVRPLIHHREKTLFVNYCIYYNNK